MDFLDYIWLGKPMWMWLTFLGIVITLLALDLGVLHKKQREIEVKESLVLSAGYIGSASPSAAGSGGISVRPPGCSSSPVS